MTETVMSWRDVLDIIFWFMLGYFFSGIVIWILLTGSDKG